MKIAFGAMPSNKLKFYLSGEYDAPPAAPFQVTLDRGSMDFSGSGIISGQIQENAAGKKATVRLIYRSLIPNDYFDGEEVARIETAASGIYSFTGINESFTYDIVASNVGWHDRVLSKVKPFAGFSPPKLLTVHYTSSTRLINLSWFNTSPVDEIRIYRSETAFDETNMPPVLEVIPGDSTSYNDLDQKEPYKTYYYAVSNIVAGTSLTSFANSGEIIETDPLYNKVRLLLNFTGNPGDTIFLDKSPNPKPVENYFLSLSSEASKFGTTSLKLGSGVPDNYLAIPYHNDINLSNETKWTVEAIAKINIVNSYARILDKDGRQNVSYPQYSMGMGFNRTIEGFCGNGAGVSPVGTSVVTQEAFYNDHWYHYAFVRNGNDLILFIDGVEKARSTFNYIADGGQPLLIGKGGGAGYATGFIQSMRITADARYTSNFTPPSWFFPTQA